MNAARHRAPADGARTQPGARSLAIAFAAVPRARGRGGASGAGARAEAPRQRPVVLFDGVCSLCSGAVRWLIRRDPSGRLRFASLQSRAADEVLRAHGVTDRSALPDSLVLIDEAGVHVRSEAALRIADHLGGLVRLAGLARLLPRPLRDAAYRWVARNRTRWFGREDRCMRPPPGMEDRFLDAAEDPGAG